MDRGAPYYFVMQKNERFVNGTKEQSGIEKLTVRAGVQIDVIQLLIINRYSLLLIIYFSKICKFRLSYSWNVSEYAT